MKKGPPEWYGPMMWNVYLVLCKDGSLYCGISHHVEERVRQHNAGKGARYTRGRRPVQLLWVSHSMENRSDALMLEYSIKQLSRARKWQLIKGEINYEIQTDGG